MRPRSVLGLAVLMMAAGARQRSGSAQAPQPDPQPAAGTAVATIDLMADAGKGLEGADNDSFAIPFLAVLQANSPQVDTVPNAKGGMFLNTVTNELYEKPFIVPCAFQRRWVRWGAREMGGGFKGEFTPAQANELRDAGKIKELDGRWYFPEQDGSVNPKKSDRMSDTRNHYVLLVPSLEAEIGMPAVFALASTGIKVSKNFLSRIEAKKIKLADGRHVPAPSFATIYAVTTVKKENEKGKWWLPEISPVTDVKVPALYAAAKAFNALVLAGKARAAMDTAVQPDAGGGGAAEGDQPF